MCTSSEEGGIHHCFSLSGWIKIVESFAVFTLIMLHRIGAGVVNQMIFFGASDMMLHNEDAAYPTEADAEILGSGTLTCLMIVTPLILLAYAVEGRKRIQATSLDPLFSFVGAALLIASGGMTCFAWNNANNNVSDGQRDRRDFEIAGTLGIMSILTGILYLIDFFFVMYQNALHAPEPRY